MLYKSSGDSLTIVESAQLVTESGMALEILHF